MSELPPPPRPPLEKGFWVALFLPIALTVLALLLAKTEFFVLPLIGLAFGLLICPLYCGIRLALEWASTTGARIALALGLAVALGFVYLGVALGGCTMIL